MVKIYIGSDHAGFELKGIIKKFLIDENYEVEDLGPYEYDADDDYPDYAVKVCEKVLETNGKGILICGSGQGMSIAANKIPGIFAVICWDKASAKGRLSSNVLCLGEKIISPNLAKKIVKIWLETPSTLEERHTRRINKIKEIEKKYMKVV